MPLDPFYETELGKLFGRFESALNNACNADARFEYLDVGEMAARKAWDRHDEARKAFLDKLKEMIQ